MWRLEIAAIPPENGFHVRGREPRTSGMRQAGACAAADGGFAIGSFGANAKSRSAAILCARAADRRDRLARRDHRAAAPAGAARAAAGRPIRPHRTGRTSRARRFGALWPRYAADHGRTDLARLQCQGRHDRRLPHDQGRQGGGADLRAAVGKLCRACELRTGQCRKGGGTTLRDRARNVRASRRRHAARRPRRRRAHPGRANLVRHLQGQPVRYRRAPTACRERDDRRCRAGTGWHLLHRLELRRRQRCGALRRARARRPSSPTSSSPIALR